MSDAPSRWSLEATSEPRPLPSWSREGSLCRRMRLRILVATLQQLLREARVRLLLVVLLTITFWLVMYVLFFEGFGLLQAAISHGPTLARTIHAVYNVFFLSLLLMLSISSGILYYASVYRSPEVGLLLTLPARAERIALQKLGETALLACWGFLLLGSPLLVAYGVVTKAPPSYYLFLPPLLVAFSGVASAVGAGVCLALVTAAPKVRSTLLAALVAGLGGLVVWFFWSLMSTSRHQMLSPQWLQSALSRLHVAEQRLLPSWWLSTGLLEAAHGGAAGLRQALGLTCVLVSNALVGWRLVGWLGATVLRRSYGQLASGPRLELPWSFAWLDRLVETCLRPLPPSMRLVLVKDIRLFRRDPLQWSQFLLFFGLLAFYFVYVRRFDYGSQLLGWMTAIGFMNLAVVGLILSTFTTRFVFPLISVEGQRFWILGTAPISRTQILWAKFLFAVLITSLPCCLLVFLSDVALQLVARTPSMALVHQWVCLELSVGLSGLSVGLGARWPNLRETSPARIAAGFGGTLTLILSALLVMAVVIPPAIPAYFLLARHDLAQTPLLPAADPRSFYLGLAISTAVTIAATVLPLRAGFRAFERMEAA